MAERAADLAKAGFDLDVDLFDALGDVATAEVPEAIRKLGKLVPMLSASDPVTSASAESVRVGLMLRMGDTASAQVGLTKLLSRVAPEHLLYSLTPGLAGGQDFLDLLSQETARTNAHPFAATALDALVRYRDSSAARPRSTAPSLVDDPPIPPVTMPSAEPTLEASLDGFQVKLTSREADVLEQLALGSSYADIAHALYITENTVKTHLAALYRKLGVDRRPAALRVSRRIGLIEGHTRRR